MQYEFSVILGSDQKQYTFSKRYKADGVAVSVAAYHVHRDTAACITQLRTQMTCQHTAITRFYCLILKYK